MGVQPGDSGYLDLVRTANEAGSILQALAQMAVRIGAPSPRDLGASEVDWQALQDAARAVMTWGTTVGELLAEGRPIMAARGVALASGEGGRGPAAELTS